MSCRVDPDTRVYDWPQVVIYADSLLHEKELVLAIFDCDPDVSEFCDSFFGSDVSYFRASHVICFDTTHWNIWSSVADGVYRHPLGVVYSSDWPSDSVQDMLAHTDRQWSELLIRRPDTLRFEGGQSVLNRIQVHDRDFGSMVPFFDFFMYRLYRARIRYIELKPVLSGIYNFGHKYEMCGSMIDLAVRPLVVTQIISINPYFPLYPISYSVK